MADWKGDKLSTSQKAFVANILKLFTQSDLAVAQNYYDYLIPKFKNNEIKGMLGSFAAREFIHQRAYALLNETLGFPESDWYAFLEYEQMRNKAEFLVDSNTNSKKGIALALVKNIMGEGVMLFASFAMLLNFERFGKMKGMCNIVEWSIRDEAIHVDGLSKIFTTYIKENPKLLNDEFKKEIYDIARATVALEDAFVDMTFTLGEPEGLTKEEVKDYVKYITNKRLLAMGMKDIFEVRENPLPWIDILLSASRVDNFFEKKSSQYVVVGMTGEWEY